jgi:hypothetical protein
MTDRLREHVLGVMLFAAFTIAGLIWPAGEMVEH